MALVVVSYSKFVLELSIKDWRENLRMKSQIDDIFPELSYSAVSPYAAPVEDFENSCGWND
jgi:hypothetical protein